MLLIIIWKIPIILQNKYTSLVLAFKTDKMTLSRRLELQNKLRDQAELNMTHEVETLKSAIQVSMFPEHGVTTPDGTPVLKSIQTNIFYT